jgi:hypothetical protein
LNRALPLDRGVAKAQRRRSNTTYAHTKRRTVDPDAARAVGAHDVVGSRGWRRRRLDDHLVCAFLAGLRGRLLLLGGRRGASAHREQTPRHFAGARARPAAAADAGWRAGQQHGCDDPHAPSRCLLSRGTAIKEEEGLSPSGQKVPAQRRTRAAARRSWRGEDANDAISAQRCICVRASRARG